MSKHQKALSSPKTYPVKRKGRPWVTKPSPGPHPKEECLPLGIIIRDVLGYVEDIKEVKKVLEEGKCDVDGKTARDHRFPVGLFDSLRIGKEYFRVLPSKKGFKLVETTKKDAKKKIFRVENKRILKGGKVQLNLSSGKNIISEELSNLETGSSVILSLPDLELEETIELKKGQEIMIIKGKNRGKIAVFDKRKVLKGSNKNRVIVSREGKDIDLPEDFIFPVDKKKIKLVEDGS